MSHVTYQIVEHDGGWAYKVGDCLLRVLCVQGVGADSRPESGSGTNGPGDDEAIEYEDKVGKWHDEDAKGSDRPDTEVRG
jgi:hypothetical protein